MSDLITPSKLAERWSVNVATLSQWRWNGKGPKYLKLGGRILYRINDINDFENRQVRENTSQVNYSLY